MNPAPAFAGAACASVYSTQQNRQTYADSCIMQNYGIMPLIYDFGFFGVMMRRVWILLLTALMLSGCSARMVESALEGLGLVALKGSVKVAGKLASQAAAESNSQEEFPINPMLPPVEASPIAADVPSGSGWTYTDTDSQDGVTHIAVLEASNVVYLGDAKEPVTLGLLLRKHPVHGNDIMLSIEKSIFHCSRGCDVAMSFNGGEPMRVRMSPSVLGAVGFIFVAHDDDKARLLYQLRSARSMHIQVPIFGFPTQHFIFNVAGLDWKYF